MRLMPSWIDITDITDVTSDSGEKIGKVRLREVHMRDLHRRTGSEATYIEHPGGARTEKPGQRPCNEGREDHKVPIYYHRPNPFDEMRQFRGRDE